jgi:hypothetical protein
MVDDRGLLFDGINDYATMEGLLLNQSYTLNFWIKPHGDGTLFASTDRKSAGHYSFGISGFRTRYEDSFNDVVWTAGAELIENYTWQNVAISADWATGHTELKVYKNGYFVDSTTTAFATLDRQDYEYHHLLGANAKGGNLYDFYAGFIWSFRASNRAVANFNDVVFEGIDCGSSCDFCAEVGKCLGECNWNAYWSGRKCAKCPSWCSNGCQSDGTC